MPQKWRRAAYRCCSARTGSSFFQKQHSYLEYIDFLFFRCMPAWHHLTDDAKKFVFRAYRAALPHLFYTKIQAMEDDRWKLFFTQCNPVFHNHLSENGKKNVFWWKTCTSLCFIQQKFQSHSCSRSQRGWSFVFTGDYKRWGPGEVVAREGSSWSAKVEKRSRRNDRSSLIFKHIRNMMSTA